jgi:hypothetical protein
MNAGDPERHFRLLDRNSNNLAGLISEKRITVSLGDKNFLVNSDTKQ